MDDPLVSRFREAALSTIGFSESLTALHVIRSGITVPWLCKACGYPLSSPRTCRKRSRKMLVRSCVTCHKTEMTRIAPQRELPKTIKEPARWKEAERPFTPLDKVPDKQPPQGNGRKSNSGLQQMLAARKQHKQTGESQPARTGLADFLSQL